MIDRETWLLLAERLEQTRVIQFNEQQARDFYDECVELVFDEHDQARIVTRQPDHLQLGGRR